MHVVPAPAGARRAGEVADRGAARARCCSSWLLLPVSAAKPACRTSFAPAAASDHVSTRPKRGATICVAVRPASDPGADAARAGDELADRLADVARLDGLLGLALDERLADEARDVVAGDRARRLERREREHEQVERAVLARFASERLREQGRTGEAGGERAHDRGVGALRGVVGRCHPGTLCLSWSS